MKNEQILFVSDLHIPFHNMGAVRELFKDIKKNKYSTIVLGGDIIDMISPSHFDKIPEHEGILQNELNVFYLFMNNLRKIHKGKLIYIIGNHETRVDKYLKRNHGLYGLDVLNLKNLLKCDKYDMSISYEYHHKNFLFTHGRYANKYSAAKELDVNNISGISGHVHRHSVACKTHRKGEDIWISAPCMQDFKQQTFAPNPNWQTGWVVLSFDDKGLVDYKVRLI